MKRVFYLLISLFILFVFIGIISAAQSPAPGDEGYIAVAEVMPEPIGGLAAINKKISYPDFAKRAGVEGKVYVLAFINENGDVDDVKLIKGIGMGCDDEVLDAVKTTKFKPGYNKGVAVKAKFTIAISFKLTK